MDAKELRSRKSAIRQEIKKRMQAELDERKLEIKERIRHENLTVAEKRERYRREVHEEKLRLMALAKDEFRARKRMLGPASAGEEYGEEAPKHPLVESPPAPEEPHGEGEEIDLLDDFDPIDPAAEVAPEEAFVFEDGIDVEVVHDYQSPISEGDAFHPELKRDVPEVRTRQELKEESVSANSLFYYVINLVIHPVQALDQFDDYLNAPGGVLKVILFYFLSLLPLVVFGMVGDSVSKYMPGGLIGSALSSAMSAQPDIIMMIGQTLANLLLFSGCIAIVNYFVTDEANFLTLTLYFAFVEGVTRIVIYTLVIIAAFGAITAVTMPQFVGTIGLVAVLLLLAFIIWTFALNMIVLMSAYGYDFFLASALSFGATILRLIIVHVAFLKLGLSGF